MTPREWFESFLRDISGAWDSACTFLLIVALIVVMIWGCALHLSIEKCRERAIEASRVCASAGDVERYTDCRRRYFDAQGWSTRECD